MAKKIKYNIYRHIDKFVALREFVHPEDEKEEKCYQWDRLQEDIERDGLLQAIRVFNRYSDGKIIIADGNHRVKVLKKLYDDTYLVPVVDKADEPYRKC